MMKAGAMVKSRNRVEGKGSCALGVKDILESKREEILRIAAKYGASNIRVFGSAARAETGRKVMWICS